MDRTDARAGDGGSVCRWRALVAVFVLYGLALSGVLGAASAAFLDPHDGTICRTASLTQAGGEEDRPVPADHHAGQCCLSVIQSDVGLPTAEATDLTWPRLAVRGPARPADRLIPIRGPPAIAARPRAPPSTEMNA